MPHRIGASRRTHTAPVLLPNKADLSIPRRQGRVAQPSIPSPVKSRRQKLIICRSHRPLSPCYILIYMHALDLDRTKFTKCSLPPPPPLLIWSPRQLGPTNGLPLELFLFTAEGILIGKDCLPGSDSIQCPPLTTKMKFNFSAPDKNAGLSLVVIILTLC